MNPWIWLPILIVFLLWLSWFFSEVKPVEVKKIDDGFVPEAEIGTFRIVPRDEMIHVERYIEADYYVASSRAHPRWAKWDHQGYSQVWDHGRNYTPAKFKTEREAEAFIKGILEREEKARVEAEEKKLRQAMFVQEHPVRTIPPYKYLS